MKRALALALTIVLVLALLPLAASARSLTDGEESIFEELRSPAKTADGSWKLPEVVITMAKNWLMATSTELTPGQIESVLSYIKDAEKTVVDCGTGVVAKWSQETRDHILDDIDGAAKVIGLAARGHAAGTNSVGDQHGYGSIEVYDPNTDKTIVAEDELVTIEYAPEEEFEYEVKDGVAIITKYTGTSTEVVVPPTLGGTPVGGVDDGAFDYEHLTEVSLPETVKPENISENAFEGSQVDSSKDVAFYDVDEGNNGAIKPEGYDLIVIVLCVVGGVVVLGACVFVAKKAKLF